MGVITGRRITDSGNLLFVAIVCTLSSPRLIRIRGSGDVIINRRSYARRAPALFQPQATRCFVAPAAKQASLLSRKNHLPEKQNHLPDLLPIGFTFKWLFFFGGGGSVESSISGSARSSQGAQGLQRCVELNVLLDARLSWWAWLRRRDGDVREG